MELFHTIVALSLITNSIPVTQTYAEELYQNENEQSIMILVGVNSTETIITPKPVDSKSVSKIVKKTQTVAQTPVVIPQNQGSCYDYVDEAAAQYGVDAGLMYRIIKAESGGNPLAKNKNSTASGCGQFIKSTWEGTLRQMGVAYITPFDAKTNVEAMAFKISRGGIRAWDASRSKWDK